MQDASSNGAGSAQFAQDWRHAIVTVNTEGSFDGDIRFQISTQEDMPDFDAAQSEDNRWSYVQLKDLANGNSIQGSNGISPAGTDVNQSYEVNTNGIMWLNVRIFNYVAGNADVVVRFYDNE